MRYAIIVILSISLTTPVRAGDGLWTSFKQRIHRTATALVEDLVAARLDADLVGRGSHEILVAAELLARRGAHPGERVEMATTIAAAWMEAGRPEEARRVLDRFSHEVERIPTKATRSRALYELAQGWAILGDDARVEALAADLPRPDAILAELGAVHGEAGDLDGARTLAARVKDPGARGKLLGRTARARVEAGDLDGALALLPEIQDVPWRTSILQAVGVTRGEAGDCKAGRAAADQLLGVPGIDPKTIDLSGGMARRSPHPRVLAKVAVACARGGDLDGAVEIAGAVPPGRQQVEALAGIAALAKAPDRARTLLAEALGRAGEIGKPGVRALALVSVAEAHLARKEMPQAREVLDAAWEAAGKVEQLGLGDARLEILALLGAVGRCGDAAARSRAIDAAFWRDGALAAAARGCAKAGDTETALALAGDTRVPLWRANAYQEIAQARLDAGDPVAALDAVSRIPSERGRVKALATLGAAHLKAGGVPSEDISRILAGFLTR